MARFDFCGGTYQSFSPNLNAEFCMNRYAELGEGSSRSKMALIPKEGLAVYASLPAGSGQSVPGGFNFAGRTFCVGVVVQSQQLHLYELKGPNQLNDLGALGDAPLTSAPAIWAANPNQVCFTVAGTGSIYVLTLATSQITKAVFTNNGVATGQNVNKAAAIGYLDGFFVSFQQNSNFFGVSNIEDGGTWDFTNIAAVSEFPDPIVSMIISNRAVWFKGQKAIVPYYDTGAVFPLGPVPGTLIEEGSAATYGSAKLGNTFVWIGGNPDKGFGIAYKMVGYSPTRISTHAVESAWASYATLADAVSFSYEIRGHKFWEIYFPTANATWVYDLTTDLWHQRGEWNPATDSFTAHRAFWHCFAFGQHLVGDPQSGNIYSLSSANTTDNGLPIRRVRRAPYIAKENEFEFHKALEILCETGKASAIVGPSENAVQLFLADSTGAVWQFEITDAGTIPGGAPAPAGQIASVPILADSVNQTIFWQLQASIGGILQAVNVSIGRADVAVLPMATNGQFLDSGFMVDQNGNVSAVPPLQHLRAPKIDMRYSDDNTNTWSNYRSESVGKTGEYRKRVRFNRLGKSRARVYEVVDSDPVNITIVEAFIDGTPDLPPTRRLTDQFKASA